MAPVLETRGLVKRFGGLMATDNVSFLLEQGARHALIGPNGAGKTTFINLLTGVLPPTAGQILLEGEDITRLRPELRVQRGLARTFQINQLFPAMTPLETLGLAVSERLGGGREYTRHAIDAPRILPEPHRCRNEWGVLRPAGGRDPYTCAGRPRGSRRMWRRAGGRCPAICSSSPSRRRRAAGLWREPGRGLQEEHPGRPAG